jgi:hypothetical protein
LGLGGGFLSAGGAAGLWETLVRPVLEYGAEVDSGAWEEAEMLQVMAGRMALGVGTTVSEEVVRGELGWMTVRARREYLKLAYWGKVVREKEKGVLGNVYREGRKRVEQRKAGAKEWCVEVKRLLEKVGLGGCWATEEVGTASEWKSRVKAAVWEREQMEWRWGLLRGGKNPKVKLCDYLRIKEEGKREWFVEENRLWVRRWVKLRAGVEKLEVELGRHRGLRRGDRICKACGEEVEDVQHLLDTCVRWSEWREDLWVKLAAIDVMAVRRVRGWSRMERVDWLLKGGTEKMHKCVLRGVVLLLMVRETERGETKSGKVKKRRNKVGGGASIRQVGDGRAERIAMREEEAEEERAEKAERIARRAENDERRNERKKRRT